MSSGGKKQCCCGPKNYQTIIVKHGQSEQEQKNLFCDWFIADFSDRGPQRAINAGKALKNDAHKFDLTYTLVLQGANKTLDDIFNELGQKGIPIV